MVREGTRQGTAKRYRGGKTAITNLYLPDDHYSTNDGGSRRVSGRSEMTEEELVAHCRTSIAGYKIPKGFTFREEPMPLSGAGKVLKTELRKPFWEGRDRQVN